MGNSKLRQSSEAIDGDDATYSDINTVNAIASVSDYNNDIREESRTDDRATLDAVEEAVESVGSDAPAVQEQEMVDQENGKRLE